MSDMLQEFLLPVYCILFLKTKEPFTGEVYKIFPGLQFQLKKALRCYHILLSGTTPFYVVDTFPVWRLSILQSLHLLYIGGCLRAAPIYTGWAFIILPLLKWPIYYEGS